MRDIEADILRDFAGIAEMANKGMRADTFRFTEFGYDGSRFLFGADFAPIAFRVGLDVYESYGDVDYSYYVRRDDMCEWVKSRDVEGVVRNFEDLKLDYVRLDRYIRGDGVVKMGTWMVNNWIKYVVGKALLYDDAYIDDFMGMVKRGESFLVNFDRKLA